MDLIKKVLKLQDALIMNKKKLRNENIKNRLHLIGLQEKVEDVLKPVIDPLKKIDESQQNLKEQITNQQTSNQLAIPNIQPQQQAQPIQILNTDPIKGVTEKLAPGIRPAIYKNRNPPEFHIGKKEIPLNIYTGNFEFVLYDVIQKIPIRQNLINLINGDDEEFTKYDNEDYIDYYKILLYVKSDDKQHRYPKRMKKLNQKIDEIQEEMQQEQNEEEQLEEQQDEIIEEIEREALGEGLENKSNDYLFDQLKLLISARNEGHNNLDDNIQNVLEELLKRKKITKIDCKNFL